MDKFIALKISPWSEKARWVLDHHQELYQEIEYKPMLGEWLLRWQAKKFFGKVTVPILLRENLVLRDSFAIVKHIDLSGKNARLIPNSYQEQIMIWNQKSEQALAAARILIMRKISSNKLAQLDLINDSSSSNFLKARMANSTVKHFNKKYNVHAYNEEYCEDLLEKVLIDIRNFLAGNKYIMDMFSFADITMAVVLQFVEPMKSLSLGYHFRQCCRNDKLANDFSDLIEWRDYLYREHRYNHLA